MSCWASSPAPRPTRSRPPGAALARQHHPDLTGDDPEAAQRATRRMAEINTAYAALTRAGETTGAPSRADGDGANGTRPGAPDDRPGPTRRSAARRSHPPGHGPRRPSGTVQPRNQTTTPPGSRHAADAASRRCGSSRSTPELRASQPTGPLERDWLRRPRPAASRRTLDEALEVEVDVRQVPRPHAGRDRGVRAVVHRLAGRDAHRATRTSRWPRGSSRSELDRRGIRRVAPAAAAGLAVEPVPLGCRSTERGTRRGYAPRQIAGGANDVVDQCRPPATRACWPFAQLFDS